MNTLWNMTYMKRRARQIENLFFLKEDQLLMAKQRELRQMQINRKALSEVSGVTDLAVLDRLVELEITPELLATLILIPLLEVAWADKRIDRDERNAVLSAADKVGIGPKNVDYAMLEQWLVKRPPAKLMEAWKHYIAGLCGKFTNSERARLKANLVGRARAVAEASGGFLGLVSPVSAAENAAIQTMEKSFDLPAK